MSDAPPPAGQDFVDRLVMRAVGAADLPVPRLPSLFEPPRPLAGLVHGDLEEEAGPEPDADPRLGLARGPVSPALRGTALATPHDGPAAHPPMPEPVQGTRLSPAIPVPSRSPRAVDRALAEARPAADPGEPRRASAAIAGVPAPMPHAPERLTRDDGDGREPDAGPRLRERREALVVLPRVRTAAPESRRRSDDDGATDVAPDSREGVLVPRARGLGLQSGLTPPGGFDRPRAAGDDGTRPGPEVAVNVTIGRIEVRAIPAGPSDAKRPSSRGPQPLALDEYLGQRGAR